MKQSRRQFILTSATATAASASGLHLAGCAHGGMEAYERSESQLRSPLAGDPSLPDLLRYATLAPSGHNTQPWSFRPRGSGVRILADLSRRTPVVDPDDHHLFVSLGCAAENLLIAAAASGRPGALAFHAGPDPAIDVDLAQGPRTSSSLCQAIPARQSTRSAYDGRALFLADLRLLEATARVDGVSVVLLTDPVQREVILDHLIRGNNAQMSDPAFVTELRDWIRFNSAQALATGDGLFSRCSGQPTLPAWIGKRMFRTFFSEEAEDAKYVKHMRSSAGVAVFLGDKADREHWVSVGRSFQRFALQATALGIRYTPINQPVEVPSIRSEFARWLGAGNTRPDLVIRFGRGTPMPMSMRRPVASVIAS